MEETTLEVELRLPDGRVRGFAHELSLVLRPWGFSCRDEEIISRVLGVAGSR